MDQHVADTGARSPRSGWRCSFLVTATGEIEPDVGPVPGDLLRRSPELVDIALALLREQQHLAYVWPLGSREPLLRVDVQIEVDHAGAAVALVGLHAEERLPHGLTLRELEVLTLLVGGLSNNSIAARLHASPRTVTTHVDRLLGKLGVPSRTAAATLALEEGLVRLPLPGGCEGFERLVLGRVASGAGRATLVPASRRICRRPLLLGAAFPLTGPAAADGAEMRRATELAVSETNARGGVAGRRVEAVVVDVDLLSESSVEQAFLKLAGEEVEALTSGYLAHQKVAHEVAADYGAPYLNAATLGAMVERVASEPQRFERVFQVCPSDVHYGPGFLSFLTRLRDRGQWQPSSNRLMVLQGAWDTSDLGYAELIESASRSRWDVAPLVHVDATEQSWQAAGELVRRAAPAAVLVGHYFVRGTVAFLRSFLTDPSPTLVYSLYAPSIPAFREELGPLAEDVLWATVTGTYSDPLARAFADRYQALHGTVPGRSHAGIAYDRANIIVSAWSRVGNPRDFRRVADEIRNCVHRGVNGAYSFAQAGQSALTYPMQTLDPSLAQAHLVYQIQDGSHRILDPAPYQDGRFRRPRWFPPPARPLVRAS